MKRELIDPFIEKISMNTINDSGSPGSVKQLQNEYLSIMERVKMKIPTSYDACRNLCYFRLRLSQLLSTVEIIVTDEKKVHIEIVISIQFMIEYLEVEIGILNQKIALNPQFYDNLDNEESTVKKSCLQSSYIWTANPIDLVEVVESLLQLGCFNKGDVVKSDFYEFIGQIFNINLSRHSGKMYKICSRPDSADIPHKRIHFLHKMLSALSERIAKLDEKGR